MILSNKLFHSLLVLMLKITQGSIDDDEGLVSPGCLAHSTLHTNLGGHTCNHHVGDAKTLKKIVKISLVQDPLPELKVRCSPGSGATISIISILQLPLARPKSSSSPSDTDEIRKFPMSIRIVQ